MEEPKWQLRCRHRRQQRQNAVAKHHNNSPERKIRPQNETNECVLIVVFGCIERCTERFWFGEGSIDKTKKLACQSSRPFWIAVGVVVSRLRGHEKVSCLVVGFVLGKDAERRSSRGGCGG